MWFGRLVWNKTIKQKFAHMGLWCFKCLLCTYDKSLFYRFFFQISSHGPFQPIMWQFMNKTQINTGKRGQKSEVTVLQSQCYSTYFAYDVIFTMKYVFYFYFILDNIANSLLDENKLIELWYVLKVQRFSTTYKGLKIHVHFRSRCYSALLIFITHKYEGYFLFILTSFACYEESNRPVTKNIPTLALVLCHPYLKYKNSFWMSQCYRGIALIPS